MLLFSWAEVGFIIFVLVYGFLLARFVPKKWYAWINIAVALGAVGYGLLNGLTLSQLGLGIRYMPRAALLGIAISIPVIIGIVATATIPKFHKLFSDAPSKHASPKTTWFELGIRIPFGTALSEEVLFRGVLLGLLLQLNGVLLSISISAILFGLWHIVPTLNTLKEHDSFSQLAAISKQKKWGSVFITVLVTTAAGFGFGYLRVWNNSLITPWIVHTVINSVAVLSGFLSLRLQKRQNTRYIT